MRDIIFRGMTKEKKWVEGNLMIKSETPYISFKIPNVLELLDKNIDDSLGFQKVLPETVGQCTGVTDANKTKIFEGDIAENAGDLYVVEWSEDRARFVLSGEGIEADFDNFYGYELEVVGNIYENKELLEV